MAKKAKADRRLGWHFLKKDMKLGYGDGRKAEIGKTLSIPKNKTPSCCDVGMHASDKISQAATFQVGPVLTRVEVTGDIDTNSDKFCGRSRKVIWAAELDVPVLKKVIKKAGGEGTSDSIGDLIYELGGIAEDSDDAAKTIDKMLMQWAISKGLDGSPIELTFVKRKLTKEIVKGFLSSRLVRTEAEIVADMGDVFDVNGEAHEDNDTLDGILDSMDWDRDVCRVESYDVDGSDGYVLKQKRTKKSR